MALPADLCYDVAAMVDDTELALLIAALRAPQSPGHQAALDQIKFRGGETRIEGKELGDPDPNAECRAAVARRLAAEKRREDLPILHVLLREEAICCRKQWGGSELLHEIGQAIAASAEPVSVPVLVWAMNQSFDCYSMLDAEIYRPFYNEKTLTYLRHLASNGDEQRRRLAQQAEQYLRETFG